MISIQTKWSWKPANLLDKDEIQLSDLGETGLIMHISRVYMENPFMCYIMYTDFKLHS